MEDIINKFNELLQEMANAVAEAKDEKEAEKLQADWDAKIDIADKEMQKELEAFIKAQDEALFAEQKAAEDEIKRLEKEFEDSVNDLVEKEEDAENTNDNHPLVNTFKKLVREGATPNEIAKQFKESELIEIGKEYGFEWTTKGTKLEKVNLLIEAINK